MCTSIISDDSHLGLRLHCVPQVSILLHRDGDGEKIFTFHYKISAAHPPRLPDGERYSNDGRNGNNQSEFPVPLQCPENYSVSLEQEERIESLQILKGKYGIYGDEESLERDLPRV